MKGKSLFLLIDELNKAERHQLLNNCKRSGDKRQTALYHLVKKWTGIKDAFEDLLDQCTIDLYEGKKDAKEQDKTQRRFIDFSIKEIEMVKLKNYLSEDHAFRNRLMAAIYENNGDEAIFQRYLHKTGELAKQNNNPELRAFFLDKSVGLTARIHTKKETQFLYDLLLQKNELIQKNYHRELSNIYNLISVLQFEDKELVKELNSLILTDDELEMLIELAKGSPEEVVYLTARARFHFFNPKQFSIYSNQARAAYKKLKNNKEQIVLLEEIAFLQALHEFHFGKELKIILPLAEEFKTSVNGTQQFYYLLFKILDAFQKNKSLPDSKELSKLKLEQDNAFRKEFLLALIAFLKEDYSSALKRLNELSYVTNPQISAWSRLMELKIHIRKENYALCESLVGRMTRFFKLNKSKEYTYNSNTTAFQLMQEELRVSVKSTRKKEQKSDITVLHRLILS